MNRKLLNKALKEIKIHLSLNYAANKGFVCPSTTMQIWNETYGINACGIYVRWFGKDQEQPPIKNLHQLYINHDLGIENYDLKKAEIIRILSKYFIVKWDGSKRKTILIIEKEI